jgi:hypothetical protein
MLSRKGQDIQLWSTASPKPLIIESYPKKRGTFDKKNGSGLKGGVYLHITPAITTLKCRSIPYLVEDKVSST